MIDRFLFVMTSASLVFNLRIYANYYVDGLKQRDVMASFRSQSVQLTGIQLFRIDDSAQDVNARGRGLRDYEWEGMISEALDRPTPSGRTIPRHWVAQLRFVGKVFKFGRHLDD
jgi:hypothetical protein